MGQISKAVIPAAGLGTRFLPATKAMPKEMLPIIDKPAIQYVVEEAVTAGLEHILMITGRNKNALENHFDRHVELEIKLDQKGDNSKLSSVVEPTDLADIHYVRQGEPLGLGHAIMKAETFTGGDPFAVLLGDDLIHQDDQLTQQLIDVAQTHSATVIGLMEVDTTNVHLYGVAKTDTQIDDKSFTISSLIEKPQEADAPSNLAIIGRYVLQPSVYEALKLTKPSKNAEIQLTDALNLMSQDPQKYGQVIGVVFKGRRFDTGDKLSYLQTSVQLAIERKDLGPEFVEWLKQYVSGL